MPGPPGAAAGSMAGSFTEPGAQPALAAHVRPLNTAACPVDG